MQDQVETNTEPLPAASPAGMDPACGPKAQGRPQAAGTCLQARREVCCLAGLGPAPPSGADLDAPGTAPRLQRRDGMMMNHPSLC